MVFETKICNTLKGLFVVPKGIPKDGQEGRNM